MKSFSKVVLVVALAVHLPSMAEEGGSWVGGGGDIARIRFEAGRNLATHYLERLTPGSIKSMGKHGEFVKAHREALIADLKETSFVWSTGNSNVAVPCGRTKFERNAPIEFDLESCKLVRSHEEAAQLLLHEVTHHFGIRDEETADKIALAIVRAWEGQNELAMCPDAELRQSAIAPRLEGRYVVDHAVANSMRSESSKSQHDFKEVSFRYDSSFLEAFPRITDRCAVVVGEMRVKLADGRDLIKPFVVLQVGATPVVVFSDGRRSDGSIDLESFQIMLAWAENGRDILFVGDDHPEPMTPFRKQ